MCLHKEGTALRVGGGGCVCVRECVCACVCAHMRMRALSQKGQAPSFREGNWVRKGGAGGGRGTLL